MSRCNQTAEPVTLVQNKPVYHDILNQLYYFIYGFISIILIFIVRTPDEDLQRTRTIRINQAAGLASPRAAPLVVALPARLAPAEPALSP